MFRHLGMLLNLVAIALFVPGILLPMFTMSMDVFASLSNSQMTTNVVDKSLSVIGTVDELWQDNRQLVAGLIVLFTIIIPIVKFIGIVAAYAKPRHALEKQITRFISAIGKWSMADVFVVAIFLAVLSTNQAETQTAHTLNLLGFKIELLMSSETLSNVGAGFYYFTAYCLISMLGTQLFGYHVNRQTKQQLKTEPALHS
ncbi:paraquat-inducible protein A [Thalassotalea fusca]